MSCVLPIHVWMIITKSKRCISSTVLLIGCLACKTFKWAAKITWLHLQSEINKPKTPLAEKGDKMCRRNVNMLDCKATLISSTCYMLHCWPSVVVDSSTSQQGRIQRICTEKRAGIPWCYLDQETLKSVPHNSAKHGRWYGWMNNKGSHCNLSLTET